MSGAVCCIAGTSDRFSGFIVGVSAKWTLGNGAIRIAAEWQSHVLQFINRVNRFGRHEINRFLVTQVITAFDCIKSVPLRMILFCIT